MEDWDQDTLEKVVESKNKDYQQNKPTDIVRLLHEIISVLSVLYENYFQLQNACI